MKVFNFKLKPTVDSKYSWAVCVSSFVLQFFMFGVANSFGTLFLELLKDFQRSESATAWIGSIAVGVTYLAGPLTTSLIDRWGCRVVTSIGSILFVVSLLTTSLVYDMSWMYLTYGVLMGMASSCLYFSSFVSLTLFFNKRLALSSGIATSAVGFGTMSMNLLLEKMFASYGWRVSMRWLAGAAVITFIAGLVYVPIYQDEKTVNDEWKNDKGGAKEKRTRYIYKFVQQFKSEPLQNKHFMVWCAALGLISIAYYIPYVYLGRFSGDIGVPASKGALLVGLLTMSQTVGKMVAGNSIDRPGVNRVILAQLTMLVNAVATCLLPLATSFSALLSYVIVAGLADGLFNIALGLVTRDILGQKLLSKGIGLVYGFIAIPLTIGAPIAGLIYDDVGSYNPVFFLSSGLMTLGVCLMFLIPWSHLLTRRKFEMKQTIASSLGNSLNTPSFSPTKEPAKYKNLQNSLVAEHIPTYFMNSERNDLLEIECGHTAVSRPSSVILFGIVTAMSTDDQMVNGAGHFQRSEEALTEQLSMDVTYYANDAATQPGLASTTRTKVDFHPPSSWKTGLFSLAGEPSYLPTAPVSMLTPYTPVSSHAPKPTAPTTSNLNSCIFNESKDSGRVSWNSETSEISWKAMSQVSSDSADSGYVDETFPCYSASESCSNDKIEVDDNVHISFLADSSSFEKNNYDNSSSHTKDTFYTNLPSTWPILKSEVHSAVTCDVKEDALRSSTEPIYDSTLLSRDSFDYCSQLAEDILERDVTPESLNDDNFNSCKAVAQSNLIKQNEGDLLKEKEINVTENAESLLQSGALSAFNSKSSEFSSDREAEALGSCNKLCSQFRNFSTGVDVSTPLVIHYYRKCVLETTV